MWEIILSVGIWAAPPQAPPQHILQAPYISCQDGHIVEDLSDCPIIAKHDPFPGQDQRGSGGNGGLLGGILGGVLGLGGLL